MTIRNQSSSFPSFYGLRNLIWGEKLELAKFLVEHLHISKQKHSAIKLLDTFMSDSFILDMMIDIIQNSANNGPEIEILLLNPFSKFAELRAKALTITNIFEQINKTLYEIRKAIYSYRNEKRNSHKRNIEFDSKKGKIDFMFEQLNDIKKYEVEYKVKIRFYELLTETPIYLISPYAMKGFILYNSSSIDNPWMIFVDDPTQIDDLYDLFYKNFNEIWKVSKELSNLQKRIKGRTKNIFLSHGRNKLVTLKLKKFLERHFEMEIKLFDRESQNIVGISDDIKNMTTNCLSAIIISKEDVQNSGEINLHQKVLQEIAYCQAKFGEKRVVLLIEEGIDFQYDISGILSIKFTIKDIKASFEDIRKYIKETFGED